MLLLTCVHMLFVKENSKLITHAVPTAQRRDAIRKRADRRLKHSIFNTKREVGDLVAKPLVAGLLFFIDKFGRQRIRRGSGTRGLGRTDGKGI
jgi:hypothetical protein